MTPAHLGHEDQVVVEGGPDVAGDAHLAQSSSDAGVDVVEAGRRRIDAAMLKKATKKRWLLRPASRARPLAGTDATRLGTAQSNEEKSFYFKDEVRDMIHIFILSPTSIHLN